jgi:hypothetical protein
VSKQLDAYREQEMFNLIQEAVDELHRIADRLEGYAKEQIFNQERQKQEGESDA